MARPLRIEYEGAWYHAMNRGAGRRVIYPTNAERAYYSKVLRHLLVSSASVWTRSAADISRVSPVIRN
jgi:hypothetical protein